jgi:hypothetical protein
LRKFCSLKAFIPWFTIAKVFSMEKFEAFVFRILIFTETTRQLVAVLDITVDFEICACNLLFFVMKL